MVSVWGIRIHIITNAYIRTLSLSKHVRPLLHHRIHKYDLLLQRLIYKWHQLLWQPNLERMSVCAIKSI